MQISKQYLFRAISASRNWGRCSIVLIISFLFLINLSGQGSGWTAPNPANYSNSATMTALVYFEDNLITDANDEVAFFVGNEIRGLASGVMIAGNVYYFITIYSNQASESMTVKYYNANLDMIFTSSIPFVFSSGQTYGNFDMPYELYFYEDNVTPITLGPIPDQMGLENCPLPSIYLSEYLNQPDTFGTLWSYINNSNLQVAFQGDTLTILGVPGFNGSTVLSVIATSQAPGNPTDTADIMVTLMPSFASPSFGLIPGQGIVKGDTFELFDLNQYENGYGGNHLAYTFVPIVEENANPIGPPSWTAGSSYTYNMTITAQVNYTPNYQFDDGGDILAAYVNGQLTGTATQDALSGLYFLSLGSNALNDTIELKFYSGLKKEILVDQTKIPFVPNQVLGNIDQPYMIELSPVVPVFLQDDTVKYHIIDTSFVGELEYKFIAYDSTYIHCLSDTTLTKICIVDDPMDLMTYYQDADGDGLGNSLQTALSCGNPPEGYVTNDDDCDDGEPIDLDIFISIIENSAGTSNDGVVCQNTTVSIEASGGLSYLWSTGETTSNINPTIVSDTSFFVTVTFASGCQGSNVAEVFTEGLLVTNSGNSGLGTLRSVLGCAIEGDTVRYDYPTVIMSQLSEVLPIDKNIVINGFDVNNRPIINIDFAQPTSGFSILPNKILTLKNVDIQVVNHTSQSLLTDSGILSIEGRVEVRE